MSIQTYSSKQRDVLKNANSRWNILTGAVRSGKTYSSYDLLIRRLKEFPDGNRLLTGKTQTTIERNILDPLRKRFKHVSTINHKGIVTIFGKPFYVVGANDESSVKKIQGLGLHYAYGDEVTTWPENFFNMLKSRLDKPGAKFDGTCNPEGPYHWLKTFIDRPDLDIFHQHFELDDNPYLDEVFKENLKKEYTGVWYQRFILGLWVMAQGIIYDMFSEKKNCIEEKDLPPYFDYYVCPIDYGTVNPFAAGLAGIKGDEIYIIKEYYFDSKKAMRQKTDSEYSKDIQEFTKNTPCKYIIIDPSAASFILQLRKDGVPGVLKANNAVLDGIRNVSSALAKRKIKIVKKNCPNLIKEFSSYVWDEKAQEYGEDKPIKQFDHCLDFLRYLVFTLFRYSR